MQKSSKGMERYPSFMPCPECFRHRAVGVTRAPPNLANQTSSSFPWKVIFSVPDLSKEKTVGSFFLSSDPWLLLWSHIFSASREKGAKQCCLGGLIIYHTAQTLDDQYSCLFQSGHLLSYVFLAAGPNSVVLL